MSNQPPDLVWPRRRLHCLRNLGLTATFVVIVAGCTSTVGSGNPAGLACAELNSAILATSKSVSTAAGSRGRIRNFPLPRFLVSRGEGARQALADRQTRRIDTARDGQAQLIAERARQC